MTKSRSFVITNFGLDSEDVFERNKTQIRFLAYGLETCPTTHRLHHQVYLYFHNPRTTGVRSLKKIGDMFNGAHVEPMRGSFQQNEAYCSKEATLRKLGDEPKQGLRGDLQETVDLIRKGEIDIIELMNENANMIHTYGRVLQVAQDMSNLSKYRDWMTEGIWYWGKTGVGKSHRAFEGFHPDTHFVKVLHEDWWDGYKGQETVIFNEYRGQFSFSFLLELMDKWPLYVRVRNKQPVPFLAKRIIFTSCQTPEECYSNIYNGIDGTVRFEQFRRRCRVRELVRYNP